MFQPSKQQDALGQIGSILDQTLPNHHFGIHQSSNEETSQTETLSQSSPPTEELLVFPNENSINRLVDLFDKASSRILIMIYRFEYPRLLDALIEAREKRQIDVKIVLADYHKSEKFFYDEFYKKTYAKLSINQHIADLLRSHEIDVVFADCHSFFAYHPKVIVIDDKIALIGTANINENGFKNARNFYLITDNPKIVNESIEMFSLDFNDGRLISSCITSSQRLAVSPGNYYDQLFEVVSSARYEVCVYQTTLAHRALCIKLASLAKSGVRVKILTSKRNSQKSGNLTNDLDYCESVLKNQPNIEYKYLNEPFYVHAKVVIVDAVGPSEKGLCFIGSSLFWNEGFYQSREIGVVSDNPNTVEQIRRTFEEDFSRAVKIYNGTLNIE